MSFSVEFTHEFIISIVTGVKKSERDRSSKKYLFRCGDTESIVLSKLIKNKLEIRLVDTNKRIRIAKQ